MTEVRFYHLQTKPLTQALPEILTKAYEKGSRVLVRTPDAEAARRLDEALWTWRPDSFLPHGTNGDQYAEDQPIWLTAENDNPNKADILILTAGAQAEDIGAFSLCCVMLDGRNPTEIEAARASWVTYKDQGFTTTYWQQTETGGWVQKM